MPSAERLLSRTPGPAIGRWFHRNHVNVLGYHHVPDAGAFREQLVALARVSTFITPDDLRDALKGAPLPPNPTLITFDDGDMTVLRNGAPVIEELGLEPILFVVGGLLDTTSPFWWDEVEALSDTGVAEVRRLKTTDDSARRAAIETLRSGLKRTVAEQLSSDDLEELVGARFEIGNHTFDHPILGNCDQNTVTAQIERAHGAFVDRGITPTAFAYPNGNLDPRAEPALERLGYDLGFLFDHHHARLDQPRLRLSRLRLDADASPERATLIASGFHGALMRLRRRG